MPDRPNNKTNRINEALTRLNSQRGQGIGPFRELLAIALLMPVIIAVVPSGAPGTMSEETTTIA